MSNITEEVQIFHLQDGQKTLSNSPKKLEIKSLQHSDNRLCLDEVTRVYIIKIGARHSERSRQTIAKMSVNGGVLGKSKSCL